MSTCKVKGIKGFRLFSYFIIEDANSHCLHSLPNLTRPYHKKISQIIGYLWELCFPIISEMKVLNRIIFTRAYYRLFLIRKSYSVVWQGISGSVKILSIVSICQFWEGGRKKSVPREPISGKQIKNVFHTSNYLNVILT